MAKWACDTIISKCMLTVLDCALAVYCAHSTLYTHCCREHHGMFLVSWGLKWYWGKIISPETINFPQYHFNPVIGTFCDVPSFESHHLYNSFFFIPATHTMQNIKSKLLIMIKFEVQTYPLYHNRELGMCIRTFNTLGMTLSAEPLTLFFLFFSIFHPLVRPNILERRKEVCNHGYRGNCPALAEDCQNIHRCQGAREEGNVKYLSSCS